ncbi:uncharacterized protein TRAVEDRAFT_22366 [Trametes versicolor FP-101664 SS1]|uniref:uncharacterized protein n=1 Tax=Trametes versicolor (strain FP-101664) TaxID=717944 RepID=UPI000462418C|nr:uncharacterized protein TRAVEDRAFT_22366 [Trametes versicolor FP-101664 SS1]EIW55971.1 hypothetical protein TRAVEDRAFT_22366 [Trametes versicolor FP-101664 SS1]
MNSNIQNTASSSSSTFTALSTFDASSMGRQNEHQQAGTQIMSPQNVWRFLTAPHEDEGYASESLSPAPEEHPAGIDGSVPEMYQRFQSGFYGTGVPYDQDLHSIGVGDVPPLDGPCYWSEENFTVLVNLLSPRTDILLPTQPLAMPLLPATLTSGSAAFPPSYNCPSIFPSTTLISPEAEPSSIPQDALAIPTTSEPTHRHSSKKRSRSDETCGTFIPPLLKKTRAHEGAVPDSQTMHIWSASALVTPPSYVEPSVAGPSSYTSWSQSVGTNDYQSSGALEQSSSIPPQANGGQASDEPLPGIPQKTKRFRRTNDQIAPTLMPGIRKMACGFPGCQKTVHPKSGETNRGHIKADHYTAAQLKSKDQLVCGWAACGKPMEGHLIMAHIEENHIGFGYKCLFRDCPIKWKGCRAKDYSQHMDQKHAGWRE